MRDTKAVKFARFFSNMSRLGISCQDADALRRIEMTLSRWSEHECNGNIQRDGEAADGKPRWYYGHDGPGPRGPYIPDRETGARKRCEAIMARYPDLFAYYQGDPRGCALYILRKSDYPADKQAHGCDVDYTRGVAVCI